MKHCLSILIAFWLQFSVLNLGFLIKKKARVRSMDFDPLMTQVGPKLVPSWSKLAPSWPQVGPKLVPSWPKLAPRWPKFAKLAQVGSKRQKGDPKGGLLDPLGPPSWRPKPKLQHDHTCGSCTRKAGGHRASRIEFLQLGTQSTRFTPNRPHCLNSWRLNNPYKYVVLVANRVVNCFWW